MDLVDIFETSRSLIVPGSGRGKSLNVRTVPVISAQTRKPLQVRPVIKWNDDWKNNGITVMPRDLQTWTTQYNQPGFGAPTTTFSNNFDITPIRNINVKSIMAQANRITAIGNIYTQIPVQVTINVAINDQFFTWNLQPQNNNVNGTPFDWNLQFAAAAMKREMDVVLQQGITFNFIVVAFDQFAAGDQCNVYFTIEFEQ